MLTQINAMYQVSYKSLGYVIYVYLVIRRLKDGIINFVYLRQF